MGAPGIMIGSRIFRGGYLWKRDAHLLFLQTDVHRQVYIGSYYRRHFKMNLRNFSFQEHFLHLKQKLRYINIASSQMSSTRAK